MAQPTVVYFDGACPLCRREISFYRSRVEPGAIEWVDLSAEDGTEVAPDLDRKRALARFHVRLPDGRLADGARAFAQQSHPGVSKEPGALTVCSLGNAKH